MDAVISPRRTGYIEAAWFDLKAKTPALRQFFDNLRTSAGIAFHTR